MDFIIKGMKKDSSVSTFDPNYAFDIKNMRMFPTEESTLFSLENEKGNIEMPITWVNVNHGLEGIPIGQVLLGDTLILFIKGTHANTDQIVKLWIESDVLKGDCLYYGELNFDTSFPIEGIGYYENEDIQKVYWVDGKNQPRVINISTPGITTQSQTNTSFDFVMKLPFIESISITKVEDVLGEFGQGVIQYCCTYYNKYLQESNVFYTSPLYYLAHNDRGASPEENVATAFKFTLSNLATEFNYVRIYSIHRTTLDATPTVKIVSDISTTGNNPTIFYDNGTTGSIVDPTKILYVGGEPVSFNTLNQKDNTLFLGGIQLLRPKIDPYVRAYFANQSISFNGDKHLPRSSKTGIYPYNIQLKGSSKDIKTFKYLDWYRFGVQFQHITGKWSEPIWINDVQNNVKISGSYITNDDLILSTASYTFLNNTVIYKLANQGYVKARPVIVYPDINDRECIAQGILCPTVYNVEDRLSNSPFAQSSWSVRPNSPFDLAHSINVWADRNDLHTPSLNSRSGITANTNTTLPTVNLGGWNEFRHNSPIPDNNNRNAEIQCITNPPTNPYLSSLSGNIEIENINTWASNNRENYYVDQSIVTLHSPEFEFEDSFANLDSKSLKLRIIGIVPLTGSVSDVDIQTSTPQKFYNGSSILPPGLYKENIGDSNISKHGWKNMISAPCWLSEGSHLYSNNDDRWNTGFVVYPWHRNGSLTNEYTLDGDKRHSTLQYKKMSNLRYSYNTYYFDLNKIWKAYIAGDPSKTGISGVKLFNSNELTSVKIPSPLPSIIDDITYYGNVDKILIPSKSSSDKEKGYKIRVSTRLAPTDGFHAIFKHDYQQACDVLDIHGDIETNRGNDPVSIKYKSTPHAVLALNYDTSGLPIQRILPTIYEGETGSTWIANSQSVDLATELKRMYWDKKNTIYGIAQDAINIDFTGINNSSVGYGPEYGFLWLGELYNDNIVNRFGGQTEEAFENNKWVACGESVDLLPDTNITLKWEEGDTYYQRYDHLKTYPYTLQDVNSMTEIVSFMCETRVNLDGRYDKNRGQSNNLTMLPSNFNLFNKVYSQSNNFFNYRYLKSDSLYLNNFNNSITWTTSKNAGELVDSWTNITLASTLDLDGDKGKVNAIKRFNNELITFQDKGISNILFNSRTQLNTVDGVPIELANSGKVDGKRYISDKFGCTNKWSICESPEGLYFIDDVTKSIFLFNGKIEDIADKLGFHSWINSKSQNTKVWNPVDFDSFVTYYDKVTGDVYFISKEECLSFSEPLGQFSSFYSYENTPYFSILGDVGITIQKDLSSTSDTYKIWKHRGGDYNKFFNVYQPYSITYIANPQPTSDKIFNNLEFKSDEYNTLNVLQNDKTFDTLKVWNEYQNTGDVSLVNVLDKPSNLKKKFRVWRVNIPRDSSNHRDRIRNPWAYIKLSKNEENIDKLLLHNLSVLYFE